MRRVLLARVGAAILPGAAPASAADIPGRPIHAVKAPAAAYDWSGLYVGAHVGYGWSRWKTDTRVAGVVIGREASKLNGGLLGLQLGFNWQTGNMVYGIETDVTGSAQKASTVVAGI